MTTSGTSSGTTVRLPGVTAEFHPPDHYIPTRDDLNSAVGTVRESLPSRQMGFFLGGLGALAALSLIEWPVAVAIGLGTVVAGQAGSSESGQSSSTTKKSENSAQSSSG